MLRRKERTAGPDRRWNENQQCQEGGRAGLTRGRRPAAEGARPHGSQETPICEARASFIVGGALLSLGKAPPLRGLVVTEKRENVRGGGLKETEGGFDTGEPVSSLSI